MNDIILAPTGDALPRTGASGAPRRRAGAFSGLRREETIAGYLFLLPNLIGFLIFSLIPIVATFGLTLTNWNLIGERTFVGLENNRKLFVDELFWQTARNTVTYTLGAVPIGVFIAFWLALLLNRKMRGVVFFRTVFFVPHVTLTVAIAIVWALIYHPELGLLNFLLFPGYQQWDSTIYQKNMDQLWANATSDVAGILQQVHEETQAFLDNIEA